MRPLTAVLITAAAVGTGIVAVLAVTARGDDTGDPPAPDTPRTHRADPPDPSYWTPERVRDARPAPMPTDPGQSRGAGPDAGPGAGGGRQSPP
ncbi:hypothetical protein [Streptomyces iranensis]|uniref:Secreted protein n=1 Tax=Streptomyces iranensis TaxID=576784 RepID=A0A061A8Z1_9ACTN|nr:hypothetical protein [Streptomyces iranensis]MBP2060350.1 hypothetical protein [Streptomyces iranensis]CDR16122.1 predicted protein [Streptomyces iranensis]